MSHIHNGDIYTFSNFVMDWVEHKKVTQQDLECDAAARAASDAPKRRRKDALVPIGILAEFRFMRTALRTPLNLLLISPFPPQRL